MLSRATLFLTIAGFSVGALAVPAAKSLPMAKSLGVANIFAAVGFAGAAQADEPDPTLSPLTGAGGAAEPFSNLYKIDGHQYRVQAAPNIAMVPLETSSVKKIGYGRVSEVRIVTTATGTYSTDALASAHLLYPGIDVKPAGASNSGGLGLTAQKLMGGVWRGLQGPAAGSFVYFGGDGRSSYFVSGNTVCVAGSNYAGCS